MNAKKRERFARAASKRTQAVIERIRLLKQCVNMFAQDFEPEDAERILAAIRNELEALEAALSEGANQQAIFEL
jgi:hypothetical protein